MIEPTYSYVKGQGWIPTPVYIYTMECGTVVRAEFRQPEIGERYTWNDPEENWTPENGWKNWVESSQYAYQSILDESDANYFFRSSARQRDWIVLIPVNQ